MSSLKQARTRNPELYGGSLVVATVSNEVADRVAAIQEAFTSHTGNESSSLVDRRSLYVNVANIVVPRPAELLPDLTSRMVRTRDTVAGALTELASEASDFAVTFDTVDVAQAGLIIRASQTEPMNSFRKSLAKVVSLSIDMQAPDDVTMMAMRFKDLEARQSAQEFYKRYFKMYFQPFRSSPVKSLQLREYKPANQGMRVTKEVKLTEK